MIIFDTFRRNFIITTSLEKWQIFCNKLSAFDYRYDLDDPVGGIGVTLDGNLLNSIEYAIDKAKIYKDYDTLEAYEQMPFVAKDIDDFIIGGKINDLDIILEDIDEMLSERGILFDNELDTSKQIDLKDENSHILLSTILIKLSEDLYDLFLIYKNKVPTFKKDLQNAGFCRRQS